MDLELKHLAPYLPYGLNLIGVINGEDVECNLTALNIETHVRKQSKPILRPMSDYEKTFNEYLSTYWENFKYFCECVDSRSLEYSDFMNLIEQHFDVFGLIDAGLAIDINTLSEVNQK